MDPISVISGPVSHLDRADVIVSLDADFFCDHAAGLRYAREFAARRRPEDAGVIGT